MSDDRLIFLDELKTLPGAIDYDSDCCSQVVFKLANGKNLRIGYDEDGLWCDNYEGLKIVGGDQIT